MKAAEGTAMELEDCAFPLLAGIDIHDDPNDAFDGCNIALLVGARPRTKGMERSDLLEANGGIFKPQGEAINEHAADDVKVLVVGNPANTNCLIAMSNAPDVPRERFTAMTRLDHNRAIAQLADKLGVPVSEITNMTIWGNHSTTQYPDLVHAKVGGQSAWDAVDDEAWIADEFIPTGGEARRRGDRGARRVERRLGGHRGDRPRSRLGARHAGGRLGLDVGALGRLLRRRGGPRSRAFPAPARGGEWKIVEGLEIDDFSRPRIDASVNELKEERDAVNATRPGLGGAGHARDFRRL